MTMQQTRTTVRTAIDFGSGSIKVQTGLVDTQSSSLVGEPFFATYSSLCLTEDAEEHGDFISESKASEAIRILKDLKEQAKRAAVSKGYEAGKFSAVATAVFRKARNGLSLLQQFENELGFSFQIIPQVEEGRLGFLTAKALFPEIDSAQLVAWDSGSGSFQFTALHEDTYQVYQGPIGHGTVRILLSREMRQGRILKAHESGNPLLLREYSELSKRVSALLPEAPQWLKDKFEDKGTAVITFGDGVCIFALAARALAAIQGKDLRMTYATLNREDVHQALHYYLNHNDAQLIAQGLNLKTVTGTALLYAAMMHFNISKILYKRTLGNTSGILISPEFW